METATNKFGSGDLYEIEDVEGLVFFQCAACMSIYSEALSWANANPDRITTNSREASVIVILTCQVTDMAILNDLESIKSYSFLEKQIYVGGCLAQRFDIPLPDGVRRLNRVVSDYHYINNTDWVHYKPPFWANRIDYVEDNAAGTLFHDYYPLRIAVGCKRTCKYCTINVTRNAAYTLDTRLLRDEFVNAPGKVVLIADSPSSSQIAEWIDLAIKLDKPIAIRNIEPQEAMRIWPSLVKLSHGGLLSVFHCPVQSANRSVLREMGRNVVATEFILSHISDLRSFTATNVIVDYKGYPNHTDVVYEKFDYVSWNPYWDGVWDEAKAKRRWRRYFGA